MNLALFSLKNKTLVWMVLLIFTAWGIWNFFHISRREDPEIKIAAALVVTIWPGAGAEQVESLVTKKLEEHIEEMNALSKISSTSRENVSVIMVEVDYNSDTDMEWQILRNKIDIAAAELPSGIIGPSIKDDFGDVTAMIYSLSSPKATPAELEEYAKGLKRQLTKIDSVGKIDLLGVQDEAVYIEGPLESFILYDFSPLKVSKILEAQNLNTPAGYLRSAVRNYRLAPTGAFEVIEQLEDAVIDVSKQSGIPLKVRDVFSVRTGYKEPPLELLKTDGSLSVGLDIRMKSGRNIVDMGEKVRKVVQKYLASLPSHVKLTLAHDQPREVNTFIGSFMTNLLGGLALVVIVLLLFMGIRAAGIIAVGLPLSIIFTLAVMPLLGVSLETVSIASFIIALGMLVDNAIIVTDNIYVHVQKGASPFEAAWKGVNEIKIPLVIGTLGTVFAFLPLLILEEEVGAYLRSLPIILSVSLTASLFLAVTLTPILGSWWIRPKSKKKENTKDSPWKRRYERLMFAGMRLRYVIIVISLAALLGSIALLPMIGMSFFPEAYRDQFVVDVWLPEGSSLKNTEGVADQVTQILMEDKRVTHHATFIGKGGPRFFISIVPEFNTPNYAQFLVTTISPKATDELVELLSKKLPKQISGARVTVKKLFFGIPVEAPVAFRVTGPDIGTCKQIGANIQDILSNAKGTLSVRDNLGEALPSYKIDIDAESAAMYGLTSTEAAVALLTAYDGLPVTTLRKKGKEIPIYLRLEAADRTFENTLHLLRVPSTATGGKVPLSAFIDVNLQWSPGVIKRFNGQRSLLVLSDLKAGVLADDVMKQVTPRIESMNLPAGYQIASEGEDSKRSKSFSDLMVAFALIIVALLFLLVVQFKSIKKALVILASVPLAIIGAILGLFFSGNTFSFMAFLGLISLAGIVIKNTVVWLEFVENATKEGISLKQAIADAGYMRFRPIMLTAGTTIGGLFPLALFGGSLWEGMAWAMIAGLASATILTVIVIPIIYYTFMKQSSKKTGKMKAAAAVSALALLLVPSQAFSETHPLEQYLAEAKKNAFPVQRSNLEIKHAEEVKKEARSNFAPIVELKASATMLNEDQTLNIDLDDAALPIELDLPPMTLVDKYVYRLSGTVTLPLYAGGKRIAGYRAANAAVQVKQHVQEAVVDEVQMGTVLRYAMMLESQYRVKLYREALEVDKQLVEAEQAKLDEQMGTPLNVSIAETRAADSERKLILAEQDSAQKKLQFNELIGRSLDAPVALRDLSFSKEIPSQAQTDAKAVNQLPQIRAMEKGMTVKTQQTKLARGDLLPQFALIGEGGYKEGDLGYSDGNDYWMLTAAVTWKPLTDGGAWRRLRQAKIEKQQLDVDIQDAKRKKRLDIARAHSDLKSTRKILEVAIRALETAKEGHENAKIAFDAGAVPISRVTEAAKSRYEAEDNYLKAYYGSIMAEVVLRFRSGRPLLTAENMRGGSPFAHADEHLEVK